jgi:hypothetical protein
MRIRIAGSVLVSAVLIAVAMGCREEGPAEKFGRKVDDATGQASDAGERAADAIDRAADKAKKKLGGD